MYLHGMQWHIHMKLHIVIVYGNRGRILEYSCY